MLTILTLNILITNTTATTTTNNNNNTDGEYLVMVKILRILDHNDNDTYYE